MGGCWVGHVHRVSGNNNVDFLPAIQQIGRMPAGGRRSSSTASNLPHLPTSWIRDANKEVRGDGDAKRSDPIRNAHCTVLGPSVEDGERWRCRNTVRLLRGASGRHSSIIPPRHQLTGSGNNGFGREESFLLSFTISGFSGLCGLQLCSYQSWTESRASPKAKRGLRGAVGVERIRPGSGLSEEVRKLGEVMRWWKRRRWW